MVAMDGNARDIRLYAGNSNPALAEAIARSLGQELGHVSVERFPDGERLARGKIAGRADFQTGGKGFLCIPAWKGEGHSVSDSTENGQNCHRMRLAAGASAPDFQTGCKWS